VPESSGPIDPEQSANISVRLNGKPLIALNPEINAPAVVFQANASQISSGKNSIEIHTEDGLPGMVYSVRMTAGADEPPQQTEGVGVIRTLSRLVPQETLLDGWSFDQIPWPENEATRVGWLARSQLVIHSPSPLRDVIVREPLAGGLMPAALESGQTVTFRSENGETVSALVRESTEAVEFLIPELPSGKWEFVYRVRCGFAGSFFLPASSIRTASSSAPLGYSESRTVVISRE